MEYKIDVIIRESIEDGSIIKRMVHVYIPNKQTDINGLVLTDFTKHEDFEDTEICVEYGNGLYLLEESRL